MPRAHHNTKPPAQLSSVDYQRIDQILCSIAPQWAKKPEQILPLPKKHIWSPEANKIVVRCVRETTVTRANLAIALNGRLDGGLPMSTSTITGIIHRHEMRASSRHRNSAEYDPYDLPSVKSQLAFLELTTFDLSESEIKHSLISPIRELSTYITVKPEGEARFFIEHLDDNQCKYQVRRNAAGVAIHCGQTCRTKVGSRTQSRRFEAYCDRHINIVYAPKTAQTEAPWLQELPKLLKRYA